MFRPRSSAAGATADEGGWRPTLTARWLRNAVFAHRLAFEREMKRDRRRLERRYEAYVKRENSRQA